MTAAIPSGIIAAEMMRRTLPVLLAVAATATTLPAAHAAVSGLTIFGDSLSDVGNVNALTFGLFPGAGYTGGKYSNGPLYVEYLANDLGVPTPTHSLAGGQNYAYGGAGAAGNNYFGLIPSVQNQVDAYLTGNGIRPNDLYVVFGGGNDIVDGDADGLNGTAAAAIVESVDNLADAGAQFILVPNLPPLGHVPRFEGGVNESTYDARAAAFNAALDGGLDIVRAEHPTLELIEFDTFGLFQDMLANPSAFGFTNVTDEGMAAANAAGYLFWDDLHPSTAGHERLASAIYATLPASVTGVPEPGALAVVMFSALVLRRKRAASVAGPVRQG